MSAKRPSGALKTVLVGCSGISRWHLSAVTTLDRYRLAAVCDLDVTLAQQRAEQYAIKTVYADYQAMLSAEKPDVVIITTPNNLHAEMTIQAAEAGARGICCEKPMATCLEDGRRMVAACRERGVPLIINHQRRMLAVFRRMRQLIAEGAIGELHLVRGSCAGDLLTDATHLVDTIRWLNGDAEANWVFGQVCRVPREGKPGRGGVQLAHQGFRYGHPVETGAFGVFEFVNGVRAEVLCGDMRLPGRGYSDYEAFGTQGRLWRAGDDAEPPLLIQDASSGGWRGLGVEPSDHREDYRQTARESYARLAELIDGGPDTQHPLSGDSALRDLEIIMAIYESARLHAKIELPLHQPRFPLEIMIEQGCFGG